MGNKRQPIVTASDLAHALIPHLEALANLRYLMDLYVAEPTQLQNLLVLQDEVWQEILQQVMLATHCH